MEGFVQNLASRGTSFDTDEMHRITKRPSKANTLEDLGSSFDWKSNTTRRNAKESAGSSYKYRPKHSKPPSPCYAGESPDLGDDELDFLSGSQTSCKSNAGSSLREKSSRLTRDEDYMSHVNQTTKATHEVLTELKFKKNGAKGMAELNTEAGPAATKLSSSKQPRKALNTHHDDRSRSSSSNLHRNGSQNSINSQHIRNRGVIYASGDLRTENITADRPKPRPLNKEVKRPELEGIRVNSQVESKSRVTEKVEIVESKTIKKTKKSMDITLSDQGRFVKVRDTDENVEVTPNARSSKGGAKESRSRASTSKAATTVKKPVVYYPTAARTPSPQAPQAFPIPSPLSAHIRENIHKSPSLPNLKSKKSKNIERHGSPTPRPREFPVSPTTKIHDSKTPRRALDNSGVKQATKPLPKNSKSKVRTVDSLFDDDGEDADKEDEESSRPLPQPFPMCTQVLATIGGINSPESLGLKRASAELFSSPEPRKKRSKFVVSSDESLKGYDNDDHDWDEDFSMSLAVDPKLLCPFCDALLPAPATPHLKKLMRNALKKSRPDPRPNNPSARKAPSAVFVTVCQRHQFESEELPKADANGWPRSIDWEKLGKRVKDMHGDLESLLTDLQAGEGVSVFWDEIQLELQKKGSRVVTGMQGQFATFDKGQPGYYGELGYAIIHETLLDLFPPTSYNLSFIAPLTFKQFMQRVLVPEVAIRLIQEDMDLHGASSSSKALQVLRDSSKYGVAMFPDDSVDKGDIDDLDQLGAADLIVMERARKRRKELEEEEIREEEALRIEKQTRGKQSKRRSEKEKGKKRNKKMEDEEKENTSDDVQVLLPRPKPKPKFRPRSQENSFPHAAIPPDELSNDELMDYCPSFLKSSQGSTENPRTNGRQRTRSSYKFRGTEEEILVPNSDPEEDSECSPFTRAYAQSSPSLQSTRSDIFTESASSSEDIEVSSPVRQRRHDRKSEDEENTPKPLNIGRARSSGDMSYPLLAARVRRSRVSNVFLKSNTESEETWLTSMISQGSSAEAAGYHWLLSDSYEE